MKKAFANVVEPSKTNVVNTQDSLTQFDRDLVALTEKLMLKQRQLDRIAQQEQKIIQRTEKEIEYMNRPSSVQSKITSFIKRDKVLEQIEDLDEMTDELSFEKSEVDEDSSILDAEPQESEYNDLDSNLLEDVLVYTHCAAHNIQLVVKDGLKLDDAYIKLINKISKDIVAKSEISLSLAEELRKLDKRLSKNVITRWNSTLAMIRSVLSLTPAEFQTIRSSMKTKTAKQKEVKKNFFLTKDEREMLEELKTVLEMFEFVTDELQSIN